MKLPTDTIINATRAHLSPSLANALPAALATMSGGQVPELIEDRMLGEAFMRAALGGDYQAGDVYLEEVRFDIPSGARVLQSSDALQHQFIGAWLGATLAEAIGAPIVAGARATNLGVEAPSFEQVYLSINEGRTAGLANLRFMIDFGSGESPVQVSAFYGPIEPTPRYLQSKAFDASALYRIGVDAGARPRLAKLPTDHLLTPFQVSGAIH